MHETAPAPVLPSPPVRPEEVPEKFWDPATGTIRVDALLKSYLALERRLSQGAPASARPAEPEEYAIACPHGLFEPDPEVNRQLHAAGLTQEQAQTVYDLAAGKMVPLLQSLVADLEAEREVERLVAHFGGAERWAEMARQMLAWAERNLPADAVRGLASSFDGVLALHEMMKSREPATVGEGEAAGEAAGERDLYAMLRDPRYWRDRDPAFIARVTEGFRRLYPDRG